MHGILLVYFGAVHAFTDSDRLLKGGDGSWHRSQRVYLNFENGCSSYGSQGCHIGADLPDLTLADSPSRTERNALIEIYHALDGGNWEHNFGWKDGLASWPCYVGWYGVECDERGRIIVLDLANNKLSGSIPAALGLLTEVRRISFSSLPPMHGYPNPYPNHIQGKFPNLQQLSNLEVVELSGTEITELPYIHLHRFSLQELSCTDAKLQKLPYVVTAMPKLEILDLARNQMSSELSDLFGQGLGSIRYLSLADNNLRGEISTMVNSMTLIEVFDISNNINIVRYWPKGVIWKLNKYIAIAGTSLTSEPADGDTQRPSGIPRLCSDVPFCYRYMWDTHPDFSLASAEDFASNALVQETLKLAMDNLSE